MRRYSALILAIVLCLSLRMPFSHMCKAEVVWSDNFDDGNYDGWTVLNGTFTAGDHTLRSIVGGLIVHPSSVTTGTWSFDVWGANDTDVGFMSTYPLPITSMLCLVMSQPRVGRVANELLLIGYSGGGREIGVYMHGRMTGWQHYDITRDSSGHVCIYLNGTLAMEASSGITRSDHFWVSFTLCSSLTIGSTEGAIDDIVVSNTIDIKPPQIPFYRQLWFLPTAVVVIVAAIFIVALLRTREGLSSRHKIIKSQV